MTNRIDHTNCTHEATSKDRAACRKANTARSLAKVNLIEVFNSAGWVPSPNHWVFYAARRFASYTGDDLDLAAGAVLSHFAPTGDEDIDANRTRNGYTVTNDPHTMLSITLRAAS